MFLALKRQKSEKKHRNKKKLYLCRRKRVIIGHEKDRHTFFKRLVINLLIKNLFLERK